MTVEILTVFPKMFESVFASSILGRAREQGAAFAVVLPRRLLVAADFAFTNLATEGTQR